MKFLNKLLLICAIASFSTQLIAQEEIKGKGVINYEITDVDSDDPQVQMYAGMMKGSTVDIYFSKGKTKMDMNMMGGMSRNQIITDVKTKASTLLIDAPMGGIKYQVEMSKEDAEKQTAEIPTYTYKEDRAKTKEIAGYACYKVVATDDDGNEIKMYVCDNILSTAFEKQFKGLKGTPLEYVMSQGPMNMTLTAKSVSAELPKDAFDVPEGYEKKTLEELQNMRGGF